MAKVNEVRVKLHDDEIVEASLKGSSILALGFPRSKRNVPMIKGTLNQKIGIYMLIGRNKPPSAKLEVYIGHAQNISNRLSSHHSQKMIESNNWFETVVFFDSKGDMTVRNALAVEGTLIDVCKQNNRWKTSNMKGTSEDPDTEEKYVADTIEKSIILSRILGWDVFRDFRVTTNKAPRDKEVDVPNSNRRSEVFIYQGKNINAKMTADTSGKLIVLKGAEACFKTTNSTSDYLKSFRNELLRKGILIPAGNKLVFSRDFEFSRPSTAGSVITGYGVNGNAIWKLEDGTTYGDWLNRS